MGDLEALALRVEAAEGPDQELDALAYLHSPDAVTYKREAYRLSIEARDRYEDGWRTRFVGQLSKPTDDPLPRYTASLDAAMGLVPEGWRVAALGETVIDCSDPWNARVLEKRFDGRALRAEGDAKTAALALTAACLRARALQTEQS